MRDVPAVMPVTMPLVPIVAIDVDTELQTPPPAALLKVVVLPSHTVAVPVIAPALVAALTVTMLVAATEPQPFVTV